MTIEYKYVKTDDSFEDCNSCGAEAPVFEFTQNRNFPRENNKVFLCELCSSTRIGNAHEYPEQFPDHVLMKTIAAVGNIILDKTTDRTKDKL